MTLQNYLTDDWKARKKCLKCIKEASQSRFPELFKGYIRRDILNSKELVLIFKALPEKGFFENTEKICGEN